MTFCIAIVVSLLLKKDYGKEFNFVIVRNCFSKLYIQKKYTKPRLSFGDGGYTFK